MPFTLNEVVPWGRNYEEYCAMFALSADDLAVRILGCADGPASFNAELTRRGGLVRSIDPLYAFERDDIKVRIDACFNDVVAEIEKNRHQFVWTNFRSVEALVGARRSAMEEFLSHYHHGHAGYVNASLPVLPFKNHEFDLALCSHFLFLYSNLFDTRFHVSAIIELMRVAREVRIFPLLDLSAKPSSLLENVVEELARAGKRVSIEKVDYEIQIGGNEMMRVSW